MSAGPDQVVAMVRPAESVSDLVGDRVGHFVHGVRQGEALRERDRLGSVRALPEASDAIVEAEGPALVGKMLP